MASYKVVIEATAEADLRGILRYITDTLKAPSVARALFITIKERILALQEMPKRQPTVNDAVFAERGLRSIPVENYSVFYVVEETQKEVHVLRVLYNRREWQNLL